MSNTSTDILPKEVSCYPYGTVIDSCIQRGASREELSRGLTIPLETVADPAAWIDWENNTRFMFNIGALFSDEELIQIGFECHSRATMSRLLPVFTSMIYSVSELYHWSMDAETGTMHKGNSCVETAVYDIEPGHLHIEMRMRPEYPVCHAYNVMFAGVLSAFCANGGRSCANVSMEPIQNGIRYDLQFKEHISPIAHIRQFLTWPFRARTMARELSDAYTVWQDRYHKLETEMRKRLQVEKTLLEISAREQERIRQDLHDTVGQELSALNYHVQNLIDVSADGDDEKSRIGRELSETATRIADEVRRAIRGLTPVDPYPDGLVLGVKDLVRNANGRTQSDVQFIEEGMVSFYDHRRAAHLYRIAQEALNNALKYAEAQTITLKLSANNGTITLSVTDDGTGMDLDAARGTGMGLNIMEYRANILEGEFQITSTPGNGTQVQCVINNPREGAGSTGHHERRP